MTWCGEVGRWLVVCGVWSAAWGCTPDAVPPRPDEEPDELGTTAPSGGEPGEVSEWTGVVVPRAAVDLSTHVPGKLMRIEVAVGEHVAAGQVLATLQNEDLRYALEQARASARTARSRLTKRQHEEARAAEIREDTEQLGTILSEQERRDATLELHRSSAELGSARGTVQERQAEIERLRARVDALEVRADFPGVVAAQYQSPGQVLEPGEKILRLISRQKLIRFAVPHVEAASVALGSRVRFRADGGAESEATVIAIAPEVDAVSMVLVEASLDDAEPILMGVRGRVYLLD